MADRRADSRFSRLAAPLAFLLAATIAVLLVRSAMQAGDEPVAGPNAVAEQPAAPDDGDGEQPPAEEEPDDEPPPAPPPPPPPTDQDGDGDELVETEVEGATYHTIQTGDTFDAIAIQYGTTVQALRDLNPDVDPYTLRVGQRVRVG